MCLRRIRFIANPTAQLTNGSLALLVFLAARRAQGGRRVLTTEGEETTGGRHGRGWGKETGGYYNRFNTTPRRCERFEQFSRRTILGRSMASLSLSRKLQIVRVV